MDKKSRTNGPFSQRPSEAEQSPAPPRACHLPARAMQRAPLPRGSDSSARRQALRRPASPLTASVGQTSGRKQGRRPEWRRHCPWRGHCAPAWGRPSHHAPVSGSMRAVQMSDVAEATAEVAAAAAEVAGPMVAAAVPEVRREGGPNVHLARRRAGPTRAAAARTGSVRPNRCEIAAVESALASSPRPSVPAAVGWARGAGQGACSVLGRIWCENRRPSAQR